MLLYDAMITDMREGFYMPGSSDIDEYDLVDPVDILTPLGKSTFWDGVVSTQLRGQCDVDSLFEISCCLIFFVSILCKSLIESVNSFCQVRGSPVVQNVSYDYCM